MNTGYISMLRSFLTEKMTSFKSAEQMARIAGKSVPWVYQYLRLRKLVPEVRKYLAVPDGDIANKAPLSVESANLLLELPPAQQRGFCATIIEQRLGYRQVQKLLQPVLKAHDPQKHRQMGRVYGLTSLLNTALQAVDVARRTHDTGAPELRRMIQEAPKGQLNQVLKALGDAAKELKDVREKLVELSP